MPLMIYEYVEHRQPDVLTRLFHLFRWWPPVHPIPSPATVSVPRFSTEPFEYDRLMRERPQPGRGGYNDHE